MGHQGFEDRLRAAGNPANMLRNSQIGAYVYPVVPSEYSNWRDEQRAWRDSCVLFDQSHHMAEQLVEGPDALKMFSHLATNSIAKFPVDRAKQFANFIPDSGLKAQAQLAIFRERLKATKEKMDAAQMDEVPDKSGARAQAWELLTRHNVRLDRSAAKGVESMEEPCRAAALAGAALGLQDTKR